MVEPWISRQRGVSCGLWAELRLARSSGANSRAFPVGRRGDRSASRTSPLRAEHDHAARSADKPVTFDAAALLQCRRRERSARYEAFETLRLVNEKRPTDERLTDLVGNLKAADVDRKNHRPSTSEYHDASDRIEQLSREVYRAAMDDELDAEEHAELEAKERAD
jgi:hypothetical protein